MRALIISLYVMIMTVSLTAPAFAYLDPGTVSMLLQGIIAAIAGGITVVSLYYHRLKAFFFKKLPKPENNKNE